MLCSLVSADLLVTNARLVTPSGVLHGALAVRDGRIAAIGDERDLGPAERRIDCAGRLVLPGLVDPHVHLGGAFPYEQNCRTECESAAAGGVTTLLQFRRSPTKLLETVPGDIATAQANMTQDTAFHLIVSSFEQVEEIPECAKRFGVRSYKLYMGGYAPGNPIGLVSVTDDVIWSAMEKIRALGPYAYCMVHAENYPLYHLLTDRSHKSGRQDLGAYAAGRPPFVEAEAVDRAIRLSRETGCPLYVVHTTVGEAVDHAAVAMREGVKVVLETCPHYLALTEDDPQLTKRSPAFGKVSPPIRSRADQDRLWQGITEGSVTTVGTDHVPILKSGATVWDERPGFAGLATMLPSLITTGLLRGRLTAERLAEVTALGPARTFGIAPRKGAIAVGADADLVAVDLEREAEVGPDRTRSRYTSVFEGMPLKGWPVLTLRRGEVIFENGEPRMNPGSAVVLRPGAQAGTA